MPLAYIHEVALGCGGECGEDRERLFLPWIGRSGQTVFMRNSVFVNEEIGYVDRLKINTGSSTCTPAHLEVWMSSAQKERTGEEGDVGSAGATANLAGNKVFACEISGGQSSRSCIFNWNFSRSKLHFTT